jgi:hypothetical protein
MASVMAIRSEVCGRCVGEINVSVELKDEDGWLCVGLKYLRLLAALKAPQAWRLRWVMVPGIGCRFGLFEGS